MKKRRKYDKSFKEMAVELLLSGKKAREVEEELGIGPGMVNRWKREHAKYQEGSFQGNGKRLLTADQKEILRLTKALQSAEIERDILKKAVSIFSKSDGKNSSS